MHLKTYSIQKSWVVDVVIASSGRYLYLTKVQTAVNKFPIFCEIMKKVRKRYESVQNIYFIGQNVRRAARSEQKHLFSL